MKITKQTIKKEKDKITKKINKLIKQAEEDIDLDILLEYGLDEDDRELYDELNEKLMELQEKEVNKK